MPLVPEEGYDKENNASHINIFLILSNSANTELWFKKKGEGYCFIFLIIAPKAIVYIISNIFILADPNGFARDIEIRIVRVSR